MEVITMNIESDIFKKCYVNLNKLVNYGFKKENDIYVYEKNFLNNNFKAIITIDKDRNVCGKVIDLQVGEEYLGLRAEMTGEFVSKVRSEYKNILNDIKNNCFEINYFISEQANRITNYIKSKYSSKPEFLWNKFKGYGVFRNSNNNKWYGIIMNIDLSKIDNGFGEVEVINVKLNEKLINNLLKQKGFYKAYHMNNKSWITIILNDTLRDEEIEILIDKSYNIISEPEEWIVPANPKYYDVMNMFNDSDEAIWKQSSDIHINDIIYLYVAEPYSRIVFKCIAKEVNIPYEYKYKNVSINHIMKIRLIKKYDHEGYTFEYLKKFGIKAIRGPRKIDKRISSKLNL